MPLLILIGFNLLLMCALFAYGVYQFLQVEEKRKSRDVLLQGGMDAAELRALLGAGRQEEARRRLMQAADTDRFTAERALEALRREAVRESKMQAR